MATRIHHRTTWQRRLPSADTDCAIARILFKSSGEKPDLEKFTKTEWDKLQTARVTRGAPPVEAPQGFRPTTAFCYQHGIRPALSFLSSSSPITKLHCILSSSWSSWCCFLLSLHSLGSPTPSSPTSVFKRASGFFTCSGSETGAVSASPRPLQWDHLLALSSHTGEIRPWLP